MEHRYVLPWLLGIIGIVRPSVDSRRFRMAYKVKHFDISLPNSFALECLFD